MIKFTVIPKKAIWQLPIFKITVLVNFIIKNLKSKHLACVSFLWRQFFSREWEKIFYSYSGPIYHIVALMSLQTQTVGRNFEPSSTPSSYIRLLTSSSHDFYESWIYEVFSRNLVPFFRGLQSVFSTFISTFLIAIENFYLVGKEDNVF